MKKNRARILAITVLTLGLVTVGATQVREVIKILGVGAVVKQYGKDINKSINNLSGHTDTQNSYTKVVPIITIGLNTRGAIGAAQVKGSKANVEKVRAVASPEAGMFGDEIRIRAMIPIETENPTDTKNLKGVPGVGVSGIVDLKL